MDLPGECANHGIRSKGSNQREMGLNCCVAGPRGLFLALTAVMANKDGITINF